jgi:hypothetical protein
MTQIYPSIAENIGKVQKKLKWMYSLPAMTKQLYFEGTDGIIST